MQRKLNGRKSPRVIALNDNLKLRLAPAIVAGLLLAVASAVVVALVYILYTFLVSKSPAVGVAVPIILYILLVMVCSYVAANYFNTRSLVPSASVGGLCLLMSVTYSLSAYGVAGLAGAAVPLKLFFTLVGVIAGYFLVDVIRLDFLPVREQNDSYFVEDEYDEDYLGGGTSGAYYNDDNSGYDDMPKF